MPSSSNAPNTSGPKFVRWKLNVFPPNFSPGEEILIHLDDFPEVLPGDVLEVYQEDNHYKIPRLLLQVSPKSQHQTKNINRETVYIEKSIADCFKLQNFKDVLVRKVSKDNVALDSVELTFREQYMGRSEMWRIKSQLVDTCVFMNKKIDFANGAARCQVNEMWAQGEAVACGVVTEETKVVFRSPTAMIYLFIQMSSEMWEFDAKGNLYFEKAVGFLTDMFDRWKSFGASHEVTIVLFSRCFYDAKHKSQFPKEMRECLQLGFNGCFYEDFYRVVVQNERFDEWNPTVLDLKKIFTDYDGYILKYHKDLEKEDGVRIPKATISSADQGNFLEVLNMSLNTFENHYLNRNMDRTGQQSIVITPGVGIFEVDRELTQITKQRIIDSGVGSDLICVGEQPLHAVPLFKFHSKKKEKRPDDYSMPHWINLSFYTCPTKLGSNIFRPRIKLPAHLYSSELDSSTPIIKSRHVDARGNDTQIFDDYDANIFQTSNVKPVVRKDIMEDEEEEENKIVRKLSNPELGKANDEDDNEDRLESSGEKVAHSLKQSNGFARYKRSLQSDSTAKHLESSSVIEKLESSVVGSPDSPFDHQAIKRLLLRPGRALINPFDPSHTYVRVTSNRRRWTHIFPKGPTGKYQQTHHIRQDAANPDDTLQSQQQQQKPVGGSTTKETETMLWGATGEQEWSAGITTGVDWKSLTIPASLPITTDYHPGNKALQNDFSYNEYKFQLEDLNASYFTGMPIPSVPFTMEKLFRELVSQRLAQGFQLIVKPPLEQAKLKSVIDYNSVLFDGNEIWLSIGRLFHKIQLYTTHVNVTIMRPRNPVPDLCIEYRYRFQAPDNDTYEVSWVRFRTEKLENYNWNHMDFYVCTKGDGEFPLTENLKYWRLRMQLIPLTPFVASTKEIMDGSKFCDIYPELSVSVENKEGFHRFLDSCINGLKRKVVPPHDKKSLNTSSSLQEISEAMLSATHGLPFLAKTPGFADDTFLSYDAVYWLTQNGLDSMEAAIEVCQKLLESNIIRHASGIASPFHPFKYGYCFYTFVRACVDFPYKGDLELFHSDWLEVEAISDKQRPEVRMVTHEFDNEDRLEWVHVKYQGQHCADAAFEFKFVWTVASGALIAELAHTWARKAPHCLFLLIPIPRDPFALPITLNSDPVRGPIFVEMKTDFMADSSYSELDMFIFRETVAKRFGFISCSSNSDFLQTSAPFSTDNQYVHCTGNMFVLIPTQIQLQTGIQGIKAKVSVTSGEPLEDVSGSARKDNSDEQPGEQGPLITRHLTEAVPLYDHSKTGFLWSWNFMISKRWKTISNTTGATGDIPFMDKMLRDFRAFCANTDSRLEKCWGEFKASRK